MTLPNVSTMYAAYFGLSEPPFSISPDPRYLYMSTRHREAMAHLLYGIQHAGGFVQLTGEVGTGKTTLCRYLLSQLPEHVDVALLLNPSLDENELLTAICDELEIDYPNGSTTKQILDLLNDHLLAGFANGRCTVLIIDEAQILSTKVLEYIRLLTNLETTQHKLLQIILIGQPELNKLLQRTDLQQLAQRITARYHLRALSARETVEYIRYRLGVAGCRQPLFTIAALRQVHRASRGVPRLVNVICHRALLGAYSQDRSRVDRSIVRRAAREVLSDDTSRGVVRRWLWAPATAVLAAAILLSPAKEWVVDGLLPGPVAGVNRPPVGGVASQPVLEPDAVQVVSISATPPGVKTAPLGAVGVGDTQAAHTFPATMSSPMGALGGADTKQVLHLGLSLTSARAGRTPRLSELLREYSALSGKADAASRLAKLWDKRTIFTDDERVCKEVQKLTLQCLHDRGTWNNLRRHNRAAVLVLKTAPGLSHHVVITRIGDDSATLDFAGEQVEYAIAEVDRYWLGDYWLLWQPPPTRSQQLGLSDEGRDVVWLRQALKQASDRRTNDMELNANLPYFDNALLEQVMGFQRRNALDVDGVVGVETFMRLNTVLNGNKLPLLVRSPTS